jgi:hypothetical protein
LWLNIRFLPSIVAEKNATKNGHIQNVYSMCIKILVGFYTHWTYMHIFRHIFLSNYWWQKSDIWSQASYRYPISWGAFFDTLRMSDNLPRKSSNLGSYAYPLHYCTGQHNYLLSNILRFALKICFCWNFTTLPLRILLLRTCYDVLTKFRFYISFFLA